jgi:hypothetical protein
MKDAIAQYFIGTEAEKRKAINSLMEEWLTSLAEKDAIHEYTAYFSPDGFFPGYYKQKHKVLFVGREPRWVTVHVDNNDSIASVLNDNGNKPSFWRRIFYMVQLFKSDGKIGFEQLIKANDYANKMAETGDYGFAFMNISKYSNDTDEGGRADWDCINTFLEYSQLEKRNYFQEELKLLDPDYIITGNLWEGKIEYKYLDLCFGKLTQLGEYPKGSPDGKLFEMDLGRKKIKLIDIYHFSRPGSDKDYFYSPIKELLFSDKK